MHVGKKAENGPTDKESDGRRVMTLKLDLWYIKKQSHMQNFSSIRCRRKVEKEKKLGKLC